MRRAALPAARLLPRPDAKNSYGGEVSWRAPWATPTLSQSPCLSKEPRVLIMALSGHEKGLRRCSLSGVKRIGDSGIDIHSHNQKLVDVHLSQDTVKIGLR